VFKSRKTGAIIGAFLCAFLILVAWQILNQNQQQERAARIVIAPPPEDTISTAVATPVVQYYYTSMPTANVAVLSVAVSSATAAPIVTPKTVNTNLQPVNLPSGKRALTGEEKTVLKKLENDITELNASIKRLDTYMINAGPDEEVWYERLENEFSSWRKLLQYYKTTPMPGKVGSLLLPEWLAALARLERASELMPISYRKADGIGVSRADQEIDYAEFELIQLNKLIAYLKA